MQFLSIKKVCERYSISRSTVLRLVELGKLPRPIKIGLAAQRWAVDDLEKFEIKMREETIF